jgi:hypothetical protein
MVMRVGFVHIYVADFNDPGRSALGKSHGPKSM